MKKILSFLLALLILFPVTLPVLAEKDPIYNLELDSQGAYLLNLETHTALYEKAENARMFPASTTKIMTALVVLQNCKDPKNETITITDTAPFAYIIEDGGVHMELKRGETFTVYDLLVGLLLASYCDVADLLALHFGDGNIQNFVDKMNGAAKDLGLENTHFENPHGLHENNHYSSPKDIAAFTEKALEYDLFREIISLRNYTIPEGERKVRYTVSSFYPTNDFYMDSYVGGKSGFTDQAGRCLVAVSEKDGVSYISVLLGANMDSNRKYPGNMAWIETHTLLTYAYENFTVKSVLEKGVEVGKIPVLDSDKTVPVLTGSEIHVLVRKDAEPHYTVDLPENIHVNEVKNGKEIGKLQLFFNEEEAPGSYPLLLSWDGTPITTKSSIEKGAESAAKAISGIFKEDRVFVILFILLLLVIFICLPAFRISQYLQKKKSHRPKH